MGPGVKPSKSELTSTLADEMMDGMQIRKTTEHFGQFYFGQCFLGQTKPSSTCSKPTLAILIQPTLAKPLARPTLANVCVLVV